jgi:excisionase family DNA binding protein
MDKREGGGYVSDKVLTPEQVAERLQIVPKTVYRWLNDGRLEGVKLGRLWRVREDDLEAFLQAASNQAHKED